MVCTNSVHVICNLQATVVGMSGNCNNKTHKKFLTKIPYSLEYALPVISRICAVEILAITQGACSGEYGNKLQKKCVQKHMNTVVLASGVIYMCTYGTWHSRMMHT